MLPVTDVICVIEFDEQPEGLFADLNERTKAERWALKEESEYARVPVRHSEYETNGLIRSILFSGFMVSLIQKRL